MFLLLVAPSFSKDDIVFEAFVMNNPADATTNLRATPKGKIIKQLPSGTYELYFQKVRNGWWKVVDIRDADETEDYRRETLEPNRAYGIHYSVIAIGTRNYGGEKLTLRAEPRAGSKAVWSFSEEISLRPMEIRGEWVKVRTIDGKHNGWIDQEWLCGNPVTYCS